MEFISKMLFWVANSLLIPDVIILLFLFVRALILIGGTYNMYITKRKNDQTERSEECGSHRRVSQQQCSDIRIRSIPG